MDNSFDIGDRIELTHVKSATGRKLSERKYGSQLLDFDEIRTAKMSVPIVENKVVPLEVGDDYNLCFFTKSGLYQCKGRVRKRYIENKMHVMEVIFLTDLKKYQRRRFYRLDCMFSIQYRVIVEDDFQEQQEKSQEDLSEESIIEWEKGTISDLSGGGIRFHGDHDVPIGTIIEVKLPLSLKSGIVPLTFMMQVIACVHHKERGSIYEIRGEFLEITDREREMVIRYVFEEQRRRMRKE